MDDPLLARGVEATKPRFKNPFNSLSANYVMYSNDPFLYF